MLEPPEKYAHDPAIEFILQNRIFVARIEIRIVIHLNQIKRSVRLLHVDAVQTVANQISGLQSDLDTTPRRQFDRQRFGLAVAAMIGALLIDDLPMAFCHIVLAGKQRLAVENADPPVERRGQELLGDQQLRFRQEVVQAAIQLRLVGDFDDALREGAVGFLEHAGESQLGGDLLGIVAVHDHRGRRRNLVTGQQFRQVDLVGASHDRLRIINDDQPLARRAGRIARCSD